MVLRFENLESEVPIWVRLKRKGGVGHVPDVDFSCDVAVRVSCV